MQRSWSEEIHQNPVPERLLSLHVWGCGEWNSASMKSPDGSRLFSTLTVSSGGKDERRRRGGPFLLSRALKESVTATRRRSHVVLSWASADAQRGGYVKTLRLHGNLGCREALKPVKIPPLFWAFHRLPPPKAFRGRVKNRKACGVFYDGVQKCENDWLNRRQKNECV